MTSVIVTITAYNPSVVSQWHFDGDVLDSSGNGNNGTLNGGVGFVTGQINQALSFDGVDGYVNVPLNGLPATMTDVTVEFWANTPLPQKATVFMANADEASNRFTINLGHTLGNIYWDFGDISGAGRLVTPFDSSWYNQWAHWAFVVESGVGMKVYRNGVLIASKSGSSTFMPGTKTLDFARNVAKGWYWQGQLDEFKIYSTALDAATIASHAAQ